MSKDRDYIEKLFSSDGVKAPESLSEEKMLDMLERAELSEESTDKDTGNKFEDRNIRSRRFIKRFAAVAAAALIAVIGISGLANILNAPPDTSSENGELYTFKSEAEIRKLLTDIDDTPVLRGSGKGSDGFVVENELSSGSDELLDYESEAPVSAAEDTGSAGHSSTYLQVDDVDEADIIKTDGQYIYYVSTSREVVILSAKDGKTERLSVIGNTGIENYIDDIYVKDDKLITVGTFYRDGSDEASSGIVVYDISDRGDPEVLYDFSQTGSILTSRMVGDYVYLVTNDYVYEGGRTVPMCGSGSGFISMDASDICCVPDPRTTSFIVLSAVDVSSGKKGRSSTKAILGAGSDIYCNDSSLYIAVNEWDSDSDTTYTRIVRAGLDGINVKFNATAKVRGYVDSQFSMDERGGYFRIATTSQRGGMDVNNLFILDSELKEAGRVTGFARNESIRAVRYIGDKAYVITYEAIDPLFIIDLSDPEDPQIEGEVMIDGFSTLLIPVSEGRLLGIGHATGDNGYGGEYDSGLKIALFDISDPSEPKVLDSREFEDMTSPAQSDHHALMVNDTAGYYAIPYEVWHYADTDTDAVDLSEDEEEWAGTEETKNSFESGLLIFNAGDTIDDADQHALGEESIRRSVYIGDWIYALDGDGSVYSFQY